MQVHRFTPTDPRLGRHQVHDPRSRGFAMAAAPIPERPVMHRRHVPIFSQGDVGMCTATAGLGMLATAPLWRQGDPRWTAADAERLYSEETRLDDADIPGHYPPDDTGSAGIYMAQALKARGLIQSYWHAFSLTALLGQLATKPVCIGIPWFEAMFKPDVQGIIRPGGGIAGGHEVCVDGIDPHRRVVRIANSWGTSWGYGGRCWMTWDDLESLLGQGGDAVTVTR